MAKKNAIQIEYLPISEIQAYANNPRDNKKAVDAVARSIERFGVRTPAIIDRNNVLIAGHTRILAAIKLGLNEFPCVRADDLSENEAKAFRLADNRMQEDSEWNTSELAKEFAALRKNDFDLTDTGFDEFEIEGLLFEPEEPPATGTTVYGTDYVPGDLTPYDVQTTGEPFIPEGAPAEGEEIPPEFQTGGFEPETHMGEPFGSEQPETFACIICCRDEADKEFLRELLHEEGNLKQHYTIKELMRTEE